MQIEILITAIGIKLGVFFSGRYLGSSRKVVKPKKRPRRRSHASLTSDLERRDVSFLLGFSSMCMYFVGCLLMKNKPLTEKV